MRTEQEVRELFKEAAYVTDSLRANGIEVPMESATVELVCLWVLEDKKTTADNVIANIKKFASTVRKIDAQRPNQ